MGEYDISVKGGKTLDARKVPAKPVVNDKFDITMTNCKSGPSDSKLQDARKMCAKPAGTSDWEVTMI